MKPLNAKSKLILLIQLNLSFLNPRPRNWLGKESGLARSLKTQYHRTLKRSHKKPDCIVKTSYVTATFNASVYVL